MTPALAILCLAMAFQLGRTVEARSARHRTAKLNAEHRVELVKARMKALAEGAHKARSRMSRIDL